MNRKILLFASILAIFIGILLRFKNIDTKVYWIDESFTSLQVSGYLQSEVKESLFIGQPIKNETLKIFQYPIEKSKDYSDTVKGLISFEPQHTPGYFLLLRAWLETVGNSIYKIRLLSVVFSLLSIILMYFLCSNLFDSKFFGILGSAVLSLSPFHLIYAHEARPFGMWIALTLFSCLTFQMAKKSGSFRCWLIYSVSLSLSLYTFLFSILTILSHLCYILFSRGKYINGRQVYYWSANLIALLSFLPWVLVLIANGASNGATEGRIHIISYPRAWIRHVTLLFADFNLNDDSWLLAFLLFSLFSILLTLFSIWTVWYCLKYLDNDNGLFLTCLLFVPFLLPLLFDIFKGGSLTTKSAYLIPSLLSFQVLFTWMIGNTLGTSKRISSYLSPILYGLFTIGLISCIYMVASTHWWSKEAINDNLTMDAAKIINSSSNPLIVSDSFFLLSLQLSHYLEDDAYHLLIPEPTDTENPWVVPRIPTNFDHIFIYRPSDTLLNELSKEFILKEEMKEKVLLTIQSDRA